MVCKKCGKEKTIVTPDGICVICYWLTPDKKIKGDYIVSVDIAVKERSRHAVIYTDGTREEK